MSGGGSLRFTSDEESHGHNQIDHGLAGAVEDVRESRSQKLRLTPQDT